VAEFVAGIRRFVAVEPVTIETRELIWRWRSGTGFRFMMQ
jgi:hypothetical protein